MSNQKDHNKKNHSNKNSNNNTKNNNNKRDKFVQPAKKSKTPLIVGIVALGAALIVGGAIYSSLKSQTDDMATATIGQKVEYSATQELQQLKLSPAKTVEDKVVVASLADLKENKFILTEYQDGNKRVPLTAMVKPDGGVVVAVSLCEPCRSESFRILGDKILCNACDTTWDLDSFAGVSGACQEYPPELLQYIQNGDYFEVEKKVLDSWSPRV